MTRQTFQRCELTEPGPTIEEFEALAIDAKRFNHQCHIFVAWSYLRDHDLLVSIARFRNTLKRFTLKLGEPGKYHETITWFFTHYIRSFKVETDTAYIRFVNNIC